MEMEPRAKSVWVGKPWAWRAEMELAKGVECGLIENARRGGFHDLSIDYFSAGSDGSFKKDPTLDLLLHRGAWIERIRSLYWDRGDLPFRIGAIALRRIQICGCRFLRGTSK